VRLVEFWLSHRAEWFAALAQHLFLTMLSTGAAVGIGVPLGIVAARRPRLAGVLVTFANVVQTVPSLAAFGFLVALPLIGGVGASSALVVLILYGLLPVLRNTIAGLRGIDRAVREAGVAMGMTAWELLFQVDLPLAAPTILAGVRVAAVVGVGSATIGAAIGAGGLGDYIFRGLAMTDPTVILAGAIPAALLALAMDGALGWVESSLKPGGQTRGPLLTLVALAVSLIVVGALSTGRPRGARVVVGSKNFTEQVILGELLAQTLERFTPLRVDRRLNLGGTFVCEEALKAGAIDTYVEYSGTALAAIFHLPSDQDHDRVLLKVKAAYAATGRTLLQPLGFNNTFAILVRAADARRLGIKTIDDAVPHAKEWKAAFGYEFLEREDGYGGFARAYNVRLAAPPRVMDLTLSYRALAGGAVDLIAGDATAGLIQGLDLFMLEDNRHYFPPYDAAPVVATATLERHPEIGAAFGRLAGKLSDETMRRMNYAVDGSHKDAAVVVREFLDALSRSGAPSP